MTDARKRFVTHTSKNVDCPLRQNPRALISGLAPSAVLFQIMSAEEFGLLIGINAGSTSTSVFILVNSFALKSLNLS